MSTQQEFHHTSGSAAPAPKIRNAGTRPPTPHKLFVNLPVNDLQRTIEFFEALGFAFNTQFTDATATCMLVGEDAYVMFLVHDRFTGFSKRPIADSKKYSQALFSFSVNSRAEVDATVKRALASGGSTDDEPEDHGFMYEWSFRDLDGHGWGVFWMDPAAVQG
jgi:predicted lactoylglutathione lyase